MDQVNKYREKAGATSPIVTITDYDIAMRSAVADTYPETHSQLCIFPVNKNIIFHIKKERNKAAAGLIAATLGLPLPSSQAEEETNRDRAYGALWTEATDQSTRYLVVTRIQSSTLWLACTNSGRV